MTTTVILPFPPSLNSIWRHSRRNNRTYLSERYKTWKRVADSEYLLHKREWEPVKGPFRAVFTFDQAHRGRSDLDNRVKAVFDWLQRAELIENDRLCASFAVAWGKANGGCKVVLTPIPVSQKAA